jgi:hypothetical protein
MKRNIGLPYATGAFMKVSVGLKFSFTGRLTLGTEIAPYGVGHSNHHIAYRCNRWFKLPILLNSVEKPVTHAPSARLSDFSMPASPVWTVTLARLYHRVTRKAGDLRRLYSHVLKPTNSQSRRDCARRFTCENAAHKILHDSLRKSTATDDKIIHLTRPF